MIPKFSIRFPKSEVVSLARQYDYSDDTDVLLAGKCAREAGFYTRTDFLRICEWKTRGRPRRHYERNSEQDIRTHTAIALTTSDERTRISSLDELPGVALRTASTLLHLACGDPCSHAMINTSYPIIDFRALWSLNCDHFYESFELWWSYVQACRGLATECGVSMRDLDRALWEYSAENQRKTKCTEASATS